MKIQSAEFIKGIRGTDDIMQDGVPQVAFIGRSNVGKSSVINSLVNLRDLARSSSTPGRTRELNFYLINRRWYLVDLPGYGFASGSLDERDSLRKLILWYLLYASAENHAVVLVMDAYVGLTRYDREILEILDGKGKRIIIVANKIDKLKKSEVKRKLEDIQVVCGPYEIIPYSAKKKINVQVLSDEIFRDLA